MKLEHILSPVEMAEFSRLVKQAHQAKVGSVRLHLAKRGLVAIGILDGAGQVLTWFVAPAKTPSEAALTETTVLAGIGALSLAYSVELGLLAAESAELADQTIRKAAQCRMH